MMLSRSKIIPIKRVIQGLIVLIALPGSVIYGCNSQKPAEVATEKKAPLAVDAQIKAIQDDPKMPPAAKEAAIRALQQNQATGAAMRQANQKK